MAATGVEQSQEKQKIRSMDMATNKAKNKGVNWEREESGGKNGKNGKKGQ